ncbi:LytR C-terminal domain-containing protein [Promicromonospora panici]|uniref:LytR C-terminal domain-containing protein n=1 Tax=Promicromonospora panici TaxID=2219658 RepID=UPI0013EA48B9|nr:LytR C-terminal domain-containing protein [Promicromonospora panici]
MTSPGYDQARVERRRREHERQAVVFGVLIAFLAVCGIFALAVYSGAISSPFNRPFTTVGVAEQESYPVPCLPAVKGQPDGALPVAYSKIEVRVLNATAVSTVVGEAGAAAAFENELDRRGFEVIALGDYEGEQKVYSELRFGKNGVVAAYTLAEHLPDVRLVLDDRKGRSVDLLVGEQYEAPYPLDDVAVSSDQPLQNREGCVAIAEITPQPLTKATETPATEASE